MSFIEQGKTAYFAGLSREGNPHREASARALWFEGYDLAKAAMNF